MNPLLPHMLKVAFCIAAFYPVYYYFLSRDTMHSRNRFFILLSLLASFILPFIIIPTRQALDIQFFGADLTAIVISPSADSVKSGQAFFSTISTINILSFIYLAGIIVLSLKLSAEMLRLLVLIIRKKRVDKVITITGTRISGFTAFGHIFIDEYLSGSEREEIIRHEQKHLGRGHFLDILFLELVKLFQWFNPFVYLFDRSLRAVHEFQADEECIKSGIPLTTYQELMLDQVFKTKIFSAANRFSNSTLTKKRMVMMAKKRSGTLANLKILMALPVLVLLLISFSTCSKKSFDPFSKGQAPSAQHTIKEPGVPADPGKAASAREDDAGIPPPPSSPGVIEVNASAPEEPFVVVEEMPMFPGGRR